MKQILNSFRYMALAAVLLSPVMLMAQKDNEAEEKVKKEVEQVIITRKGDKKEKVVVEIVGDKITVNGKPLEEFKDQDGNLVVKKHKYLGDYDALLSLARSPRGDAWSYNNGDVFKFFTRDSNRAILGVNTESAEKGVRVKEVTKESADEKSGLREGDIITKVDDTRISESDGLSKVIRSKKPGDKVTITYLRDNKEQKATAELKKLEFSDAFSYVPRGSLGFNIDAYKPKLRELENLRIPNYNMNWSWNGNSSKLGLSVQDTDDGKGVKVIGVDDDSNADKAGLKENDVITEVDGKAVNSTDEMVKLIRESKTKTAVMVKLTRNGKTQNIEVKMPRKIKSADL